MNRFAALIALALLAFSPPAQAGPETSPEGRRIASGPKLIQQSVDGIDLQLINPPRPGPGRRVNKSGRSLRAGPTQPISVGIVGCPGCGTEAVLEGAGRLIVLPVKR